MERRSETVAAIGRRLQPRRPVFPSDVLPFVEILMSPADPEAPLTPIVDVVLEPKQKEQARDAPLRSP